MIVWRGRGGVIFIIGILAPVIVDQMTEKQFGVDNLYHTRGWTWLGGLWLAAAIVYALRGWLGVGKEQVFIVKDTGQEVRVSLEGTLYMIPARYWPLVLIFLGIFGVVVGNLN